MTTETELEDELIEPGLPPEEEVKRLRKTNKSVLAKSHERKGRIAELETENAGLKTKAEAAETKLREAVVGVPLRKLTANMSNAPGLFLSEFEKRFKVESVDGELIVNDLTGKTVMEDGKPIAFSGPALWRMLTGGASNYAKTEDASMFALLLKWNGPSGSGASGGMRNGSGSTGTSPRKPEQKAPTVELGLR